MRKYLIGGVILFWIWHLLDVYPNPTPGVLAPDAPVQTEWRGEIPTWKMGPYTITPLAGYMLKARVLHREDYYWDRGAAVSPLDLALGWGRMSDPGVYEKLHIGQGLRWYTWTWYGEPPIPAEEIPLNSANTHIIPATPEIKAKLRWIKAGDVVKLSGYLVQVQGLGGEPWRSSMTRTDGGDGSCELMWVTEAERVGR